MRRRYLISSFNTVSPVVDTDSMYIEALENGMQVKLSVNDINYSLDNNTWEVLMSDTYTPSVSAGQKIYFKGRLTPTTSDGIGTFTITKSCNVGGNVLSLLSSNSLTGYNYTFRGLFNGCTTIKSAAQLSLSVTNLVNYCYAYMFKGCTSLTETPELPATKLANYCYSHMFEGCTSLVIAPQLPATTLITACYDNMFRGCTALKTAPELLATTLAGTCYAHMFQDCTSLITTPELSVSSLANGCYRSMFEGCTSLKYVTALPATILKANCYHSMFRGCTQLARIPALLATTLATECYAYMFYGCSRIVQGSVLPAIELVSNCYDHMFGNCNNMRGIKALFVTEPGESYTLDWLSGVSTNNGKFIKNSTATWELRGASGIPESWNVITYNTESPTMITFTIQDIGCQAEENMSWAEWIDSEYNTGGFIKKDGVIFESTGEKSIYQMNSLNDIINPWGYYNLTEPGAWGEYWG